MVNKILNGAIILAAVLILFFVYSAWVDKPLREHDLVDVLPSEGISMDSRALLETQTTGIVVRILNGNGTGGVAYKLREYLLTQGFDVSETTNADHFNYEKTIVYLHSSDYSISTKVSRALGIENNPIMDDRAPNYPCDITVLMGKDYKQLPPFLDEN